MENNGNNKQDYYLPWGSGGTNAANQGTPNAQRELEDYNAKFGPGIVDFKKYMIKLKDPNNKSTADEADKAAKRNAQQEKSRFPKDGWYKPTKKTIEWAINNNRQFATGGFALNQNSAIVGDSLNGKENREIVTWHPNGLSIRPEKAGPENGYSPLSLDQFAKGGFFSNLFGKKEKAGIVPTLSKTGNLPLKSGVKENNKSSAIKVVDVSDSYMKNNILSDIKDMLEDVRDEAGNTTDVLSNILTGLSIPAIVAAPMGVGTVAFPGMMAAKVLQLAGEISGTTGKALKMGIRELQNPSVSTGARITRFATGGTAAITGDSSGANIFAKGAKPELVQSNGDMVVTPLNKGGSQQRQKVDRMTSAERNSALATSLASHIVKYTLPLGDGITEISNSGEAIKVYDIKPGIADRIDVGGSSVSLIELIAAINAQLQTMGVSAESQTQLLGTIAAKATTVAANTTGGKSSGGSLNPFLSEGFPSNLDGILSGR